VFAFAWTGAALAAPAGRRVVTLVLTALLWLASYGILLVVNDWWASFRTEGPLLCALCFTCAIALDAFAARLPGLVRIVPVVVVAAVATLLLNVWVVGRDFVVRPLGCEWRTLTADVAAHASATSIVAVPRRASDDLVAPGLHHDLGWPASSRNYGANAMVDVARLHLGLPRIPVTTLAPGADAPDEAAAVVVLGCRREHLR
jgi:hypothetical protein